jgi:hypothetical protein
MIVEFDITQQEVQEHNYVPQAEGHWTARNIGREGNLTKLIVSNGGAIQFLMNVPTEDWDKFSKDENWDGDGVLKDRINCNVSKEVAPHSTI